MTETGDGRLPAYFRCLAATVRGQPTIVTTLMIEVFPHCAVNSRFSGLSRERVKAARKFAAAK